MKKQKLLALVAGVVMAGSALAANGRDTSFVNLSYPTTDGEVIVAHAVLKAVGASAADSDKPLMIEYTARNEADSHRFVKWLMESQNGGTGGHTVYSKEHIDPAVSTLALKIQPTPENLLVPQQ